jgi:Flp pilus assembly protein TadG
MKQRRERGATIVEAALVLLMLITLVFAAFDFGRAYNVYQVMTNAAREGARYAVAPQPGTATVPTDDQIRARVKQFVNSAYVKIEDDDIDITRPVTPKPVINNVDTNFTRIEVTSEYDSFFVPGLNVTLRTEAMMRDEIN